MRACGVTSHRGLGGGTRGQAVTVRKIDPGQDRIGGVIAWIVIAAVALLFAYGYLPLLFG